MISIIEKPVPDKQEINGRDKILDAKLIARGINKAAHNAEWLSDPYYGRPGWTYPVYDEFGKRLTRRWKNATYEGMKYAWPDGKQSAEYYIPSRNFLTAIRASGGVVWIANGEPAALAFMAAGISNVFSWFGENSVPTSLPDKLAEWEVTEVHYPADNDDTGRESAAKVRDMLLETCIRFKALSWGKVAEKYDANDLWIDCGFDHSEFVRRLDKLDALLLRREKPQPDVIYDWSDSETPTDLVEVLARVLGVSDWRTNDAGWTRKRIENPIDSHGHDDQRPGSSFNLRSGVLIDFKGRNIGPYELAQHFGIDTSAYQRPTPVIHERINPALDEPINNGLTDARDYWDDIKLVERPPDLREISPPPPTETPIFEGWPDNADGILWGIIAGVQAWLPRNSSAIVYALDHDGKANQWLSVPEIAALPMVQKLELSLDQLYSYFEKYGYLLFEAEDEEDSIPHDEFVGKFSLTDDVSLKEKKPTNTGGSPAVRYKLKLQRELVTIIRRQAQYKAVELVAQYDGKAIPLEWTQAYLADLPGVSNDCVTLEALHRATQQAVTDPEFAEEYRLYIGRYSELLQYTERELLRSDYASEYPIDADVLGKDSAHNVMAAQLHRYYYELEPDRNGNTWLFAPLVGVSKPTLRNIRKLAGLRYTDDTRETVEIALGEPKSVAAKIAKIGRSKSGRALFISSPGYGRVPYRSENLKNVLAYAAHYGGKIQVEYCVSQPLERYTPADEPEPQTGEAESISRKTEQSADHEVTECSPRKNKATRADLFLASFRRIPKALGWEYDGENWVNPDGLDLYPDHVPTLLKAITGLDVPGAIDAPLCDSSLRKAPDPETPLLREKALPERQRHE